MNANLQWLGSGEIGQQFRFSPSVLTPRLIPTYAVPQSPPALRASTTRYNVTVMRNGVIIARGSNVTQSQLNLVNQILHFTGISIPVPSSSPVFNLTGVSDSLVVKVLNALGLYYYSLPSRPIYGAPGQVGVGPGGVTASCSNCNNTVCWWCWGNPGFEDCKTECDKLFQGDLDSVLSCYCTRCVNEENCGGVGERATEFDVWRQYAATTCDTQKTANLNLDANGYQQLKVDCILGPRTCGAISQINTDEGYTVMAIPDACFGHESEWIPPTKKGAGAPPDCRTQPSRCSATQSCDQSTGECFEDCRKPGATPCGAGRNCDQATGNCVAAPPPTAKKGGAGAGVFVLGLAALLGIGFALTGRG